MGRIILYLICMIIWVITSILFPRSSRRFYRRSMFGRNYYGDDHTFDYVRMFIRRRRALSKARKFVKRKGHNITLKNSNVMLVFDTKLKTFALLDIRNIKHSATVIEAEQNYNISDALILATDVDTVMEQTFDSICRSFSDISNYYGILQILKGKFNVVKENISKEEPKRTNSAVKPENQIPKVKLNINTLDENSLSKLPGISVILAKKIVNRMNFKGNFLSLEEFYNEMKIKSHFQKKLNELICVKPVEHKKNNNDNDRIIDL